MRLAVIDQIYEQQKYMYDKRVHSVPDRIVSISQPYISPIVKGKAVATVEFDVKLDFILDENGMALQPLVRTSAWKPAQECKNR